jgi:hypothetical protein
MSSHSAERIGGWLLAPLAWLLVALLSASLSLLFFANALMSPDLALLRDEHRTSRCGSPPCFALAMWYYTLWLTIAFLNGGKGYRSTILSGCSSRCCWR